MNDQVDENDSALSPRDIIASGYTSPVISTPSPSSYRKLPLPKETYLAYVVAIRDPLNFHLDIYWPKEIEKRYANALNYEYTFVSEELSPEIYARTAYSCHLKGVEITSSEPCDFSNMKEAYILISTQIAMSGGWVLISVSDIDVYRRVLITVYDVITRESLNELLLNQISPRTGLPIAKEYMRPSRTRGMFLPQSEHIPKDYHIVFSEKDNRDNSKNFQRIPNSLVQI